MSTTDIVLVTSHLYLICDLAIDWESFGGCQQPVHKWLLLSYALMLASRLVFLVGSHSSSAEAGSFLLNARQKTGTSRWLFRLTWAVIVPAMAAWTVIGTVWLYQVRTYTPDVLPLSSNHLWIMIIWQVVGYAWIAVHCRIGAVAWLLEQRVRAAEAALREVRGGADDDAVARWGSVADELQDYTSLARAREGGEQGMAPAEITALASTAVVSGGSGEEMECAICLDRAEPGDVVRHLPACGHGFHRACIDLWLLRCAACPLCKADVRPVGSLARPPAEASLTGVRADEPSRGELRQRASVVTAARAAVAIVL